MIYGLNFGGRPIGLAPMKFARQIKYEGQRLSLVGVTDSDTERASMVVEASNGRRQLYVRQRARKGVQWFAIYAG